MGLYISGMSSGLDWRSMIEQIMQAERQPIRFLEQDKSELEKRKSAWSDVNSKLLAFKSAAAEINDLDDFDLFSSGLTVSGTTRDAEELLGATIGSNASLGSYSMTVDQLASAQKLGSRSFGSQSEDLDLAGSLLINGRTLNVSASDSLFDIRDKINNLNSGDDATEVVASVFTTAENEYMLTLASENTGAAGIELVNASGADLLGDLGLADGTLQLNAPIANGALSSSFSSSTEALGTLFGLTGAPSGTVTVAGQNVAIDLDSDSLQDVSDKLNAAGVSASVVSSTDGDDTTYRLQVDGLSNGIDDLTDSGNVLQTLGLVRQGHGAVQGLEGATAVTSGGQAITESTLINGIDGFSSWDNQTTISIGGFDHDGNAVSDSFAIGAGSTVGDLLDRIEQAHGGNASAYVDGEGKIVVEDNLSGSSSMTLTLSAGTSVPFGDFGAEGTGAVTSLRNRELVAGQDAQITIDGQVISRSDNQIDDVIAGVTLELKDVEEGATLNLNINRDKEAVKEKIQGFVDSYNELMTYIGDQAKYTPGEDGEADQTPPLFGDSTLHAVRSNVRSMVIGSVGGLDSSLNALSVIGITHDRNGQLTIDDDKLDGYLASDFNDVRNLFVAQGSSANSDFTFIDGGETAASGTYDVEILQAATQGSVLGSGFGGTLAADTDLTLTARGKDVVVSLSSGWGIADIVNAINSAAKDSENLLGITATNEGGQLKIANDSYGADSFTVSGGASLGLADGDYAGLDVSGQIRLQGETEWQTMTGSGQSLTVDDDQDAAGLLLNYGGSVTGTFDFTFAAGIGEGLERLLDTMTDSVDGTVAGKEELIQNQVTRVDDRIAAQERRMEQRESSLYSQFVAMETMLSQLQSQQQWLTGQLSGLG